MQDVFGGGAIVEGDTPAEAPAAGKGVSAAGSFEADITFTSVSYTHMLQTL